MSLEQHFIGPFTERQTQMYKKWEVQEELKQFIPERCASCSWLSAIVVMSAATKVSKGEISEMDAAAEVSQKAARCTGSKHDPHYADAPPICDLREQDKRSGWVS